MTDPGDPWHTLLVLIIFRSVFLAQNTPQNPQIFRLRRAKSPNDREPPPLLQKWEQQGGGVSLTFGWISGFLVKMPQKNFAASRRFLPKSHDYTTFYTNILNYSIAFTL